MVIGDIVVCQSTLFWKLKVKPTRFRGTFCEPVTRYFESAPPPAEPHGPPPQQQQECWFKCSLTEQMINGRVYVDIEFWERQLFVAPTASEVEQQQQQHHQQQRQGVHAESYLNPPRVQYQTLSLHTPKTLAPIVSVFLPQVFQSSPSFRVELDASAVLYKGLYQIEFVLSEEIPSNRLPGPASCHRLLESLYHDVVATFLPDQTTADVWFEFRRPEDTEEQQNRTHDHEDWDGIDDNASDIHDDDHDGSVEVVGAHSQVLERLPYFAGWIEYERHRQEEQRKRQLEEEWRIHRQQQQQQQQPLAQQQQRLAPHLWEIGEHERADACHQDWEQVRDESDGQLWSDVTLAYGCVQGYIPPDSLQGCPSQENNDIPAPRHPSSQLRLLPSQIGQSYHSLESYQEECAAAAAAAAPLPQDQVPGGVHTSAPIATTTTRAGPELKDTLLPSPPPQIHHDPMQSSQTTPLPALRIHVDDMTLETFQIVLQFIYTGQIGLSEQLLQDIKMYWGENQDNTAPSEIPPPPAETSQEQRHEPRWPSGGGGGLPFATCAANDDHDDDRETTSWETLLEAAQRFGLGELKYRAMKAVQYHRQMLALRDRVSRHTVAEGSSHDGFGGPALDLQLALGEQILRSMLSLHQCPRLKEREDGRVEVMTAEEEEEEEGEEKGSRSTRTRVGLTREQQQQHQGEDGESCVRPGGDDAEVEAMDESSPSSCTRVGMQGEWRAEGNTAGAEREEEREDGEEGSQVCDDASWSRRVHVEKEVGKKDLFQDPECEEALLELCSNLRERFFVMHRIMHTCND